MVVDMHGDIGLRSCFAGANDKYINVHCLQRVNRIEDRFTLGRG